MDNNNRFGKNMGNGNWLERMMCPELGDYPCGIVTSPVLSNFIMSSGVSSAEVITSSVSVNGPRGAKS